MFGLVRFFLSYLVIISHLTGSAYAEHFGFYAVRAFFVISGFLMTSALHEVYRFDGVRFWTNRLLRLLPLYFLICLLTLTAIILLPSAAEQFHWSWRHSGSVGEWTSEVMANLLVFPLQFPAPEFRLLPPYWSVAVELEMYVLLYLIAARNIECAMVALAAGVVFHVANVNAGLLWDTRYFTAAGAIMPYASGAVMYFLTKSGVLRVAPWAAGLAMVLWLANLFLAGWTSPESYVYGTGYYLNGVIFAVVVAGVAQLRFARPVARFDRAFGEIAYPVFLAQWLVGFLVAVTFFPGTQRGWALTLVATPFIIAAGFALALVNRKFVEPVRLRLRETPRESPLPLDGATARAG